MDFRSFVRPVSDYPTPGQSGWDLCPLLADARAFAAAIDAMAEPVQTLKPTHVLGLEAGGFTFASALAQKLGLGFVPARRPGKLAPPTLREEHGASEALEIREGAFGTLDRVLIVDDLLATGETADAARKLILRAGAQPVALTLFAEHARFEGRDKLAGLPVFSLLRV